MPILNKILNVVNLLLAIVVCAACFVLYKKRTEIKERDEALINHVTKVVSTLDGSLGTTYKDKINASKISWQEYAKNPEAYKALLSEANTQAEGVLNYSEALAEGVVKVASAISENPAISEDERKATIAKLKNINNYDAQVNELAEFTSQVYSRGEGIIDGIVDASQVLDPASRIKDRDSLKILGNDQYKERLTLLKGSLTELVSQRDAFNQGYDKIAKSFESHSFETDLSQLTSKDTEVFNTALNSLVTTDFEEINRKLEEFDNVEANIIGLQSQIERQQTQVNELNGLLTEQKNNYALLGAKFERKSLELKKLKEKYAGTEKVDIPRGIRANILEINDQFGFVVIDKGTKDQLKEKAQLLVHRGKDYVCKLVLTRCLEKQSIAEIAYVSKASMPIAGDSVVAP